MKILFLTVPIKNEYFLNPFEVSQFKSDIIFISANSRFFLETEIKTCHFEENHDRRICIFYSTG